MKKTELNAVSVFSIAHLHLLNRINKAPSKRSHMFNSIHNVVDISINMIGIVREEYI